MRSRNGKGSDAAGSGSDDGSDARTSSSRKGADGRVRRHSDGHKSLARTAWTLVKQVFFTIVHIYKSMTAFWSQMHVCMLPALGELDHEQEQQEREQAEQEELAAAKASGDPAGSPGQRKRSTKVN